VPVAAYRTELSFAREVAALGGRVALHHYRKDPRAKQKPDGSYVTEGDWTAEAQIRLRIARTWPDHNIHGEEEGLTAAGGGPPTEGAPTWIVDPIDGTNNYMAGIPIWATLVALRVDGVSVVGVVHAPALGETYDAAVGSGARMNGEPIRVADVRELGDATLVTTGLEQFIDRGLGNLYGDLVARCRRSRGFGDFWGHMLVARGAAHVAMEPEMFVWDFAALEPIVTEAGGRITQFSGDLCAHGCSCLTANSVLHDSVRALAAPHLR
jgi:histidinol-phosphatase